MSTLGAWHFTSFHFSFPSGHQCAKQANWGDSNAVRTHQLRYCGCQPCVCVIFDKFAYFLPGEMFDKLSECLCMWVGWLCSCLFAFYLWSKHLRQFFVYYAQDVLPRAPSQLNFKVDGALQELVITAIIARRISKSSHSYLQPLTFELECCWISELVDRKRKDKLLKQRQLLQLTA